MAGALGVEIGAGAGVEVGGADVLVAGAGCSFCGASPPAMALIATTINNMAPNAAPISSSLPPSVWNHRAVPGSGSLFAIG
jgi:hypothetical protein